MYYNTGTIIITIIIIIIINNNQPDKHVLQHWQPKRPWIHPERKPLYAKAPHQPVNDDDIDDDDDDHDDDDHGDGHYVLI